MNKLKKYIKKFGILVVLMLLYIITLVLLNYFKLLRLSIITRVNFIFMGVLTFILGIINGKKASKKGYLEGLKLGSIIILILLIFNLIFIRKFSLNTFVYYLVIIASTTIGSMIGINLRKS